MQQARADKQQVAVRATQREPAATRQSPFASAGGLAALQLQGSPRMLQQQAMLTAIFGGTAPAPKPASAAVVQRLGKKGHIALGALAGTFVPVIGNIIGGYIGYRIWKSKQPQGGAPNGQADLAQEHRPAQTDRVGAFEGREVAELEMVRSQLVALPQAKPQRPEQRQRSGARFSNKADDGPLRQTDRPAELLLWIEATRKLIQEEQFEQAYARLIDPTGAAALGIRLELVEGRGGAEAAAKKNMSFAAKRSIKICIVESTAWLQDRVQAGRVLPMHLEEYMHQFQASSRGFLSPNTEAFRQQSSLPDMAEDRQIDAADFDEIDVMAKLIDWGFDVQDIGYVGRYEERETFWEWWQHQRH